MDDVEQAQDFADPPADDGKGGPGLDGGTPAFELEEGKREVVTMRVVSLEGLPAMLCHCIVAILTLSTSLSAVQAPPSPQRVVIDGATTPERFPEWYRWETLFEYLSVAGTGTGREPLHKQMGVSEGDMAFLLREAKRFENSKSVLKRQILETTAAMEALRKTGDEILDAAQEHEFAYRQDLLDARARVYEALSADGMGQVQSWIEQRLRTTKVFLSGRGLANFGKPW